MRTLLNRVKAIEKIIEQSNASDKAVVVFGIAPRFRWYAPLYKFDNEVGVPFDVMLCSSKHRKDVDGCRDLDQLRRWARQKDIWLTVFPIEQSINDLWEEDRELVKMTEASDDEE